MIAVLAIALLQDERIRQLLENLAKEDFCERAAAGEELASIGKPALPALRAFLEKPPNEAARLRALHVRGRIVERIGREWIRSLEEKVPCRAAYVFADPRPHELFPDAALFAGRRGCG